jgi:hypothetical protein
MVDRVWIIHISQGLSFDFLGRPVLAGMPGDELTAPGRPGGVFPHRVDTAGQGEYIRLARNYSPSR